MSRPEELEASRRQAFAVAYRMLGSVSEAEDVAQEALLRLHREIEEGMRIESPTAYVATIATRLAIDELRSARARREEYVGEWLPEPIVTREQDDPAAHAELTDSLSFAFLRLLETLTPEQRAVLLLRDVFDYPYERIAEILGKARPPSASSAPARAGTLRRAGRASRPPASSATGSPTSSSPLWRTVTWRASSGCSRATWSCAATAAARCPRSRGC